MNQLTSPYYEQLIGLRHALPFRPYTIYTADGKRHVGFENVRMATNGKNVIVIGRQDGISRFKLTDIASIKLNAKKTKGK